MKDPVLPALINNKRRSRKHRVTSASSAPPRSLDRVGLLFLANYSLITCATIRGLRALHPANDHWRAMSLISTTSEMVVFRSSLKTTAFRRFQMLHRVRIANVCAFFSPVVKVWLKQSSRRLLSSHEAGCKLGHELQEDTACQTSRE